MIDLDLVHFGKNLRFSFVEIDYYRNGERETKLQEWRGKWREIEPIYQHY
jgi:hypothetical protein